MNIIRFDYTKNIILINEAKHKNIITPQGTYVWQPNDPVPVTRANYLSSCITILKKASTYKPLLIPALSLSLPWLSNQDISREGLITKGIMTAGFYCLLTPYGTSRKFSWFSFERAKRIVGISLLWSPFPLRFTGENGLLSGLVAGILCESGVSVLDRLFKTDDGYVYDYYLRNCDTKGVLSITSGFYFPVVILGGGMLVLNKFFKSRNT